jgi:hypothetical protein
MRTTTSQDRVSTCTSLLGRGRRQNEYLPNSHDKGRHGYVYSDKEKESMGGKELGEEETLIEKRRRRVKQGAEY